MAYRGTVEVVPIAVVMHTHLHRSGPHRDNGAVQHLGVGFMAEFRHGPPLSATVIEPTGRDGHHATKAEFLWWCRHGAMSQTDSPLSARRRLYPKIALTRIDATSKRFVQMVPYKLRRDRIYPSCTILYDLDNTALYMRGKNHDYQIDSWESFVLQ